MRIWQRSSTRLIVMVAVGTAAWLFTGLLGGWNFARIAGWAAACVTYVSWIWLSVGRLDAEATASHARGDDPARPVTDVLVLVASLASLGAILVLLGETRAEAASYQGWASIVAVASVVLSWLMVHTLFATRYASLYYRGEVGGVDFNQAKLPAFSDFGYLAFTIGMTFQVSDTTITSHDIRVTALAHALLSYLFGAVILATMINLVAGLYR
jgi:uncharacterized membrane protein